MSYILDALRRSQAERERGQVPGLHAQPAAVAAVSDRRDGGRWPWALLALAAVAGLAGLVTVALWRAGPPPAAVTAAPVAAPTTAPTTATATAPAAPVPGALPVVVSAPPTPTPQSAAPPPRVAAAPAAAPSAAPPVTPLAALSPEQRRALPPLVLGGSIWSDSALSRFVIVNGQVVREGETAAPGVVLERITPKTVLLRWRELRLEMSL